MKNLIVFNSYDNDISDLAANGDFVLNTCQRTLIVSVHSEKQYQNSYFGADAYKYLLETILGLKSKLLAEQEIMGQFREALGRYLKSESKNSQVIQIIQNLFKDAKKIRSTYLNDIGQQSYASISKHLLNSYTNEGNQTDVLIYGSGTLCESLLKLLSKRFSPILCARNTLRVEELAIKFNCRLIPWTELASTYPCPRIINTIGTESILLDSSFFKNWKHNLNKIFIDLGHPSPIKTNFGPDQNVFRLDDIFKIGEALSQEKETRIEKAKLAIEDQVAYRMNSSNISFPFGWEELKFG